MKRIIIVLIIISVIFCIVYGINIYNNTEIIVKIDDIKDRVIITKKNCTSIGNNKKELENGYYDVKIYNNDIYINKLYIEYDNNSCIDYSYLNNLIKYLNYIYDLNLFKLENKIIEYYTALRRNNMQENGYIDSKKLKGYNVEFNYYNNMLKISLNKI